MGDYRDVGAAVLRRAFPGLDDARTAALGDAVTALLDAPQGATVRALLGRIGTGSWQETRSAVSALRRLGGPAQAAVPAVAGWVASSAAAATDAEQQHTVLEALHALDSWRQHLDQGAALARGTAVEPVRQLLTDTFDPFLVAALQPPLRIWHRGAAGYLRHSAADPATVIAALSRLLDGPDSARPAGYEDWHAYSRAEIVTALAETAEREQALLQDLAVAAALAEPAPEGFEPVPDGASSVEPDAGDPLDPLDQADPGDPGDPMVTWAVSELDSGDPQRCLVAVELLRRLGARSVPAIPQLHRLLALRPADPPAALVDLQRAVAQALLVIEPFRPSDPWGCGGVAGRTDPVEAGSGDAYAALCRAAATDPDLAVRVEALDLLARLGLRGDDALRLALAAASAEAPEERRAALRLLASL